MILLVGLGNPGEPYQETKHNIGFWVVEKLATQSWREDRGSGVLISGPYLTKTPRFQIPNSRFEYVLAKPQVYMNQSGGAVKKLISKFKIKSKDLWVIHDDADLSLGKIKIQISGKRSTHNGVQSITGVLAGKSFVRFRFGIGRPALGMAWEDYVLSRFGEEEKTRLGEGMVRMVEAINLALDQGIVAAMNKYNQELRKSETLGSDSGQARMTSGLKCVSPDNKISIPD